MEAPGQTPITPRNQSGAGPTKTVEFSNDPIIRAVQEHNIKYKNNRDWNKLKPQRLGRLLVYPVEFIGENNWPYTNFVATTGDNDERPPVYDNLDSLFANIGNRILPFWADTELLKTYLLIVMAVLLILASITFAIVPGAINSLPLFVGLLGSIVGYLIGDTQRSVK